MAPLPGVLLWCSASQVHRGALLAGVLLCRSAHRHLKGHPGWGPTPQFSASGIWWTSLSIVQLLMLACGERGTMVPAPPATHDPEVSPCFHGCQLSSTGISHHSLPPHLPSTRLSTVHSSPHPGIAPQSPNSSPQLLCLLADLCPCARYVWLQQGLSWFLFHLGCHRSAVSLSALNISPLTQAIAPMWGSNPCFNSPTCHRQVQSF